MATIDERIEAAKQRLEQLKNAKSQRDARERAKGAEKAKSRDTKQKVLVGAMFLERAKKDPEVERRLLVELDKYLTRPHDRKAFNLPPLEVKK